MDVIDYELQISGNTQRTYKIYWDTSKNIRTYKENPPYTIYLNEKSITSKELIKCKKKELEKSFYLIVPDRIAYHSELYDGEGFCKASPEW